MSWCSPLYMYIEGEKKKNSGDMIRNFLAAWSEEYRGYFALKSVFKITEPWNVWHYVEKVVKCQKYVHIKDEKFVNTYCNTIWYTWVTVYTLFFDI